MLLHPTVFFSCIWQYLEIWMAEWMFLAISRCDLHLPSCWGLCVLLSGPSACHTVTFQCVCDHQVSVMSAVLSSCLKICPPSLSASSWTTLWGWTWVTLWVNEGPGAAERWVSVTLRGAGRPPSARGGPADIWQGSAAVPPRGSADCLQPTGGLWYVAAVCVCTIH